MQIFSAIGNENDTEISDVGEPINPVELQTNEEELHDLVLNDKGNNYIQNTLRIYLISLYPALQGPFFNSEN